MLTKGAIILSVANQIPLKKMYKFINSTIRAIWEYLETNRPISS
jgi:hypothetical protein